MNKTDDNQATEEDMRLLRSEYRQLRKAMKSLLPGLNALADQFEELAEYNKRNALRRNDLE